MSEKSTKDEIVETTKDIAKEIYSDLAKPAVKAVGSIIAIPFKAIDAALTPIKKWIDNKNNNYEQTRQLLADKLKNVDESKIVEPEPYVAVPAIQQLSYSYDSEDLRKMYANLLASSMISETKFEVHPSFVDIIKQLLPIEAKTLNIIKTDPVLTIVCLRLDFKNDDSFSVLANDYCIDLIHLFSDVNSQASSLKNLQRLGLINIRYDRKVNPISVYDKYKKDNLYKSFVKSNQNNKNLRVSILQGIIELTDFGQSFCKICCDD